MKRILAIAIMALSVSAFAAPQQLRVCAVPGNIMSNEAKMARWYQQPHQPLRLGFVDQSSAAVSFRQANPGVRMRYHQAANQQSLFDLALAGEVDYVIAGPAFGRKIRAYGGECMMTLPPADTAQ